MVLSQEMVRFNRLLHRMSSSLKELRQAIQGIVVMSGDLDLMYRQLLANQVSVTHNDSVKVQAPEMRNTAC